MTTDLKNAIDALHGPIKDRKKTGLLALENNFRANTVRGGRSYALGLSFQKNPNRVTANAGDRFTGEIDEELKLRQMVLEVSFNCSLP